MPTYEYACKACGEHLEIVQSFKDDALTECPACGGQLRKVFGNIGITFKGSGFYKTDSRSDSRKTATKGAETKPGDKAADAPAAKADTATAPTAEATKSGGTKTGGGDGASKTTTSKAAAVAS